MNLRFRLSLFAALMGCSGTGPDQPEAGLFDARDVIVDPRDASADAADPDAVEVAPTVDVVVYDAADVPAADVAAQDAVAPPPDSAVRPPDAAADAPTVDLIAPADAPPTPCSDLAERYAAAVRDGQSCGASAGCEVRVCETLCCTCEVFISGSPERMRTLDELRSRAAALGCQPLLGCPTTRCPPARSGACSADGRCVTLRDPPDAGVAPADAARDR